MTDTARPDIDLERRVDALEVGAAMTGQAIQRIGAEVREMHGRTAAMRDDINAQHASLVRLEDRMTDVRAGMTGLSESIAVLGGRMTELVERIHALDKDWRKMWLVVLAPAVGAILLGLWEIVKQ